MEYFVNIVNGLQPLTIFKPFKHFILGVWRSSEYAAIWVSLNTKCICIAIYLFTLIISTILIIKFTNARMTTSWKLSKYELFSGLYFLVFGLITEIYGVNLRIQSKCRKIRTRKRFVFKHFSRSDSKFTSGHPFLIIFRRYPCS